MTAGKGLALVAVEGELVDQADDARRQSTREEAEQRATAIRTAFEVGVDLLVSAWKHGDAVALGYGTGPAGWEAYLLDQYGDLRLTLPTETRRERLVTMRGAGMPVSAIKATPGAGSQGLVAKDLKALRADGRLADERVKSFDGRERSATVPATRRPAAPVEAPPGPVLTGEAQAILAVTAAPDGLTLHELEDRLGWRQGKASSALHRAERHGRILRTMARREGCAVYVPVLHALTHTQ